MGAPEIEPGPNSVQYKEPPLHQIEYVSAYEPVPKGKKPRGYLGMFIEVEPVQDGVRRYPPIQVELPRRPDFIRRYVNMPPNILSKPAPDEAIPNGPVKMLELLKPVEKPKDIAAEA